MRRVDLLDVDILCALDDDSEVTVLAMAKSLGAARNTIQTRLRRLESTTLGPASQRVPPSALGYELTAFVSLWLVQSAGSDAADRLSELPEVIELHAMTGDADLLAKVVARDANDLRRVMREVLAIEGINRTSTAISLGEELQTRTRPLLQVALQQLSGSDRRRESRSR